MSIPLPVFEGEGGWFSRSGPEHDVVLSSRVRLARNLADSPFPAKMSDEEQAEFESIVTPVFEKHFRSPAWCTFDMDILSAQHRQLLRERNLLATTDALARPFLLIARADERALLSVNVRDHFHLTGLRSGFDLQSSFADAKSVEAELESELRFAVNMEFGYLTAEVDNCGTGLRGSVLVHLPGLAAMEATQRVFGELLFDHFRVKGFLSSRTESLGHVYQISNKESLGKSEEALIRELEGAVGELLLLERAARTQVLQARTARTREMFRRAWEMLTEAEVLSAEEALTGLLNIRFGVSSGIIEDVTLPKVTALLFQVQKCHILERVAGDEMDIDVDAERADFVRQILGGRLKQRDR